MGCDLMSIYQDIIAMWQSFAVTTKADFEQRLDNFKVLFAFHSGKIENDEIDYHDTREVFEHGRVTSYQGSPRTLFEQQNQKVCYEFLLAHLESKTPLSTDFIKEVHRVMTEGTYDEQRYIVNGERPGEFKKADYVTGIHEVGSPPEYVAEDLESMLDELTEVVKQTTTKNVLKIATYFHARFESIHPFADGNGRVGRTLLNYFLMINNHPPLIVYEEDRRYYYAGLQKYDEIEELGQLQDFFINQVEKTWNRQLDSFNGKRKPSKTLGEILSLAD